MEHKKIINSNVTKRRYNWRHRSNVTKNRCNTKLCNRCNTKFRQKHNNNKGQWTWPPKNTTKGDVKTMNKIKQKRGKKKNENKSMTKEKWHNNNDKEAWCKSKNDDVGTKAKTVASCNMTKKNHKMKRWQQNKRNYRKKRWQQKGKKNINALCRGRVYS